MRFPSPVVQKVGGGVQRASSSASGRGSGDSSPLSQAKTCGNSDQKCSKSGRALSWCVGGGTASTSPVDRL